MDFHTVFDSEDFEIKTVEPFSESDVKISPSSHQREQINSVKYSLKLVNTINTVIGMTFLFTTVVLLVKREKNYFFILKETAHRLNLFMAANAFVVNSYSIVGILIVDRKVRKSAVFLLALSGIVLFFGMLLMRSRLPSTERMMNETRYALYESLGNYSNNEVYRYMWDYMQYNFHCCGVLNYRDWCKDNDPANCSIVVSCRFCNSTSEGRTLNGLYHVRGCLAKVNVYLVNAINFYKCFNFLMIALLGLSSLLSVAVFFRKFKPKQEKNRPTKTDVG